MTKRIDKRYAGVGRIAKASGATTKDGFGDRIHCLDQLYERGRIDVLRALRDGRFTVTELYSAWSDGPEALRNLMEGPPADPMAELLGRNLKDALEAWTPKVRKGRRLPRATTERRYRVSFRQLENRGVITADTTVGDLINHDWAALEQTWKGSGSDWNHVRCAVSRFVADYLDDVYHPLRRELMDRFPKRRENIREPDISPALLAKIVHAAPEHVRAAYVCLAVTQMDVGEYLQLTKDHLRTFAIEAPGEKTDGRRAVIRVDERLWGWITAAVPAPVQYKWLRLYWKRALKAVGADTTLRLKDLRHVGPQWAVNEGIAESKVQKHLRHASPEMTRRYTAQKDKGEVAKAIADAFLRTA